MMRDILDVHTHTIASGHAYNTMMEMIHTAQEKGLEVYGITEHAPKLPGSCHEMYFHNLRVVERQWDEMRLLLGVELNILDDRGTVDLAESYLERMDVVIASLHMPCIRPGSREYNTDCLIHAMKNPHIHIIGHPDDGRYPLDYEAVVQAAKETHTLLEINNASLHPQAFRQGAHENDLELLRLCKIYQASVIMGSDAHFYKDVQNHRYAQQVLEEAEFPDELVVNTAKEKLFAYINKYQ